MTGIIDINKLPGGYEKMINMNLIIIGLFERL